MQYPTTVQQIMVTSLMVENNNKIINNLRYEKILMFQYLHVSTKVNSPLEFVIYPYVSAL